MKTAALLAIISTVGVSTGAAFRSAASKPHSKPVACAPCAATTSPSSEVAGSECMDAVLVPLAAPVPLKAFSGSQALPASRLSATYGTISSSGVYTPPTDLPPMGMDEIVISDANGVPNAQVHIQFTPGAASPSPSLPSSSSSNVTSTTPVTADPVYVTDPDGNPVVAEVTTTFEELTPLNNLAPLVTATVNGEVGKDVPLMAADPDTPASLDPGLKLLFASPSSFQRGKKCGFYPPPPGSCTNGETKKVVGPTKIHMKGPACGVNIGAFGATINYVKAAVWKVVFIDNYVCEGGAWKYTGSTKCVQLGVRAWGFDPSTVIKILFGKPEPTGLALGYDLNGYKFDTAWECGKASAPTPVPSSPAQ